MKICIRSADGPHLTIPLPNEMLFSPTVLKIALKTGRQFADGHAPDIPPETIAALCAAIKDYRQNYGPWELVHVESADGDSVIIEV